LVIFWATLFFHHHPDIRHTVMSEIGYTKEVTKKGDGNKPSKGDFVSVRYKGYLTDGTVFDANLAGGKKPPFKFKVATGSVIRGWDEGILTMSKGEQAKLTIKPEWAYGKKGIEGVIPPSATLIFEVELLDF